MQDKNTTNNPGDKKPSEWPETGKQGGQGDIGKKGGDTGTGDFGKTETPKTGDTKKVGE